LGFRPEWVPARDTVTGNVDLPAEQLSGELQNSVVRRGMQKLVFPRRVKTRWFWAWYLGTGC